MVQNLPVLDHIEINVSDLVRSAEFWGWFLSELGWRSYQRWSKGQSWIFKQTYFVIVQVEKEFLTPPYHRCRVGLNHIAFQASSRDQIDLMTAKLRKKGITILYEDRHPHAAGQDSYAVFFEDPDRIKVELVAGHSTRQKPQHH